MGGKKQLSLAYCTNVHALGSMDEWKRMIAFFGPAIRSRLGWPVLPMGLWFPAALIAEIDRTPETSKERLRALLGEHALSTFTFNAFPYGNFHDKVVKTKVYHPDWTEASRLEYTVACARLLAYLLPAGATGSISTLPLGWRIGWTEEHSRAAAARLCEYVKAARALRDKEGKAVRLALEPEPGCALEVSAQVIEFWGRHLRPAAQAAGIPRGDLDLFCGICYDTCHGAVQFEDPVEVLDRLAANGVAVVKMQLSSALEFAPDPARASEALRRRFVEERFLHQTRVRTPGGIVSFDDLPEALASQDEELWSRPWRTHFHVPIDAPALLDPAQVSTTRGDLVKAMRHALAKGLCDHFEVETYTWSVMPEAHRPATPEALADCIARELRFAASVPQGKTPDA